MRRGSGVLRKVGDGSDGGCGVALNAAQAYTRLAALAEPSPAWPPASAINDRDHPWPSVATASVPPERCAGSVQTGQLHRTRRYENAFQSSLHLRTSKLTRIWRRIRATCRATN